MGKDAKVKDIRLAKTNLFLLLSNALVLAGLVYAGVLAVQSFDRAEATFLRQAQLRGDPNPCALPTPDVYFLFQALDLAPTSAVHAVKRKTWIGNIEHALCNAEFGSTSSVGSNDAAYDYAKRLTTLAFLFNNRTLRPPENFDAFATAASQVAADHPWAPVGERLLTEYLCSLTHNHSVAGAEYDNFNSKLYGDLVYRVSRAYLNAMPAFYKLSTSGKWPTDLGQSTGADVYDRTCMEQHHPFRSDIAPTQCAWIDTIRRELAAAGTAAQSALMVGQHTKLAPATSGWPTGATADSPEHDVNKFYAASMPRVDAMLYRLLALTVVGHYDRTYNNRDCFRNHAPATDGAADMCRDLYAAAGQTGDTAHEFPDAADVQLPALDGLSSGRGDNAVTTFSSYQLRMATMIPRARRYSGTNDGTKYDTGHFLYEAAAADTTAVYGGDPRPQARTCSMDERDYTRYSPPSSVPRWEFSFAAAPPAAPGVAGYTGPAGGALDAVIEACAKNMKWGLLEQTRLFGLPDAVHEFVVEPRDVAAHAMQWLYETFLNDYYVNVLAESGGNENKPAYALRLWSAFQFAMTGLWSTMFASVAGYLTAWTVVPLVAQLLPRVPLIGRFLKPCWRKNGAQQTVVRPSIARDLVFIVWTIVAVFVSVWMVVVAPAEGPVYPVDSDCEAFQESPNERGSNGGVFPTSARDVKSVVTAHCIPGWVLLGMIGWCWIYELVLVQCIDKLDPVIKFVKEYKERNPQYERNNTIATVIIIVVSAVCVGLAVSSAIMQGNNWKDVSEHMQDAEDKGAEGDDSYVALAPEAEWLAHEVRMCAITAYLQAVGVGMLSQRWVVVNLSTLDTSLYYALIGGFLVAPYWVRTTLMADQWTPLFNDADRTDQAALFSIALGFACLGTVIVLLQCFRVACDFTRGKAKSDDLEIKARQLDPDADIEGDQVAAQDAAVEQKTAETNQKQAEIVAKAEDNPFYAQGQTLEQSLPSIPRGTLGWAGSDPRGAYLPMIRIRV